MYSERPYKQKPLNYLGEKGAWAYPGLPKFLEYPILSQERVKLRISNLAGIVTGSMRTKAPQNLEERQRGRIQLLRKFLGGTPYNLSNG